MISVAYDGGRFYLFEVGVAVSTCRCRDETPVAAQPEIAPHSTTVDPVSLKECSHSWKEDSR
jgi:hypothetical protein